MQLKQSKAGCSARQTSLIADEAISVAEECTINPNPWCRVQVGGRPKSRTLTLVSSSAWEMIPAGVPRPLSASNQIGSN